MMTEERWQGCQKSDDDDDRRATSTDEGGDEEVGRSEDSEVYGAKEDGRR